MPDVEITVSVQLTYSEDELIGMPFDEERTDSWEASISTQGKSAPIDMTDDEMDAVMRHAPRPLRFAFDLLPDPEDEDRDGQPRR